MTAANSSRRLRVAHYLVQPVLVWDDGDELAPGPQTQPVQLTARDLAELPARMPAELQRLEMEAPAVSTSASQKDGLSC